MEGSNMFKRIISSLSIVVGGLAAIAVLATASHAQGVQLVKVGWDTAHPNGNPVVAFGSQDLLKTAFDTAWNLSQAPIRDAITNTIGKPDAVMQGQQLYKIVCKLAPSGTLQVASSNNQVTVSYLVAGNYLSLTSTHPPACRTDAEPRV